MAHLLLQLQQLLQHPITQTIQVQASLVLCVGIVGWMLAGHRRRRELLRLRAAGHGAFLQQRRAGMRADREAAQHDTHHSQQLFKSRLTTNSSCSSCSSKNSSSSISRWPPLAVVLPIKGCRPHSTDNWASQLAALYDGPSVFVFVVESAADPAVAAVAALMLQQGAVSLQQKQQQQQGAVSLQQHPQQQHQQQGAVSLQQKQQQQQWPDGVLAVWRQEHQPGAAGRLVVTAQAGLASTCSQKIHNILHGIQVAKALLQPWQQQQQQQQQAEVLPQTRQQPQQQQQQHGGIDQKRVHILAFAAGGSTDGSNSGNSSSCGSSAAHSRSGSSLDALTQQRGASAADDHQPPHAPSPAAAADVVEDGANSNNNSTPAAAAAAGGGGGGGYVCVLDDDVLLHPLGLCQLVDELEADPSLFMATGYPFDIVTEASSDTSKGSSSSRTTGAHSFWGRLLSYAAASYHLPLTIGFSIADRGSFVWGGAVLLRAAALEERPPLHLWQQQQSQAAQQKQQQKQHTDVPSILQVWRDGSYSDDLVLGAYCVENGLSIGLPASALYPQLLPPNTTLSQYWNYLRRQLFVLDTYYNEANRVANHTLMLLHSYGSAVFTAAVAAAALQLLLGAAAAAGGGCCLAGGWLLGAGPVGGGGGRVLPEVAGLLQGVAAWVCQHASPAAAAGSSGTGGGCAGSSVAGVLLRAAGGVASPGLVVFVSCVGLAQLSIWVMTRHCLGLMRELSPPAAAAAAAAAAVDGQQQQGGAGSSSSRSLDRQQLLHSARMLYSLLWAGWVLENALLPACMAYTRLCDCITWGGIRYRKAGGKVVAVVHPVSPVG